MGWIDRELSLESYPCEICKIEDLHWQWDVPSLHCSGFFMTYKIRTKCKHCKSVCDFIDYGDGAWDFEHYD